MAVREDESDSRSIRALKILEVIAGLGRPVSPGDLTAASGLPKATAHRLCGLLEREGFLRRGFSGRGLVPGPRAMALTKSMIAAARSQTARHAILETVVQELGETCNINIPEGGSMVYFDRVEADWPLRLQLPVGSHVPLHCTASGKLYLSSLGPKRWRPLIECLHLDARTANTITETARLEDEIGVIQGTQVGTDDEEFIAGMVAVAVPIKDDRGRLFATLSAHAPTMRMSFGDLQAHIPALQKAADKLAVLPGF